MISLWNFYKFIGEAKIEFSSHDILSLNSLKRRIPSASTELDGVLTSSI